MTDERDPSISPSLLSSEAEGPSPGVPQPTWRWLLCNAEEIITALLLAVMLGSVGVGVFWRFILRQPLSWTEEVVLICMVWLCFLGASVVTKHKEQILIDFFITLAPRRVARAMELFCLVIITGVLVVLLWQGILLLEVTQDVTTIALGIPTMYMYAAIPVSAFLMLIHNTRNLISAFRTWA